MLFTGKSELSIDAKQRLAIPAKIRTLLKQARAGEALYIIPGANGGLWLWPEPTFEKMAGADKPTLTPALAHMNHDELTFPVADRLDLDSAGRIRLPADLVADAGLGTRALLLGMKHHLEIWDPDRWAAHLGEKAARLGEIAQEARTATRNERDK